MVVKQPWLFCTLVLVLVLGLPPRAKAQNRTSGSVSGTVVDAETNEKLAGVTVIAMLADSDVTAITDEFGAFRFDALPPGDWQLKFVFLMVIIREVSVVPGQDVSLRQEMNLSSIGTGCGTFFGRAEIMVNTDGSTIGERFFSDTIKNTPPPRLTGAYFPAFFHQSPLEGLYLVPGLGTLGSPWVAHVNREFVEERSTRRVGLGPEGRSSFGAIHEITLKRGTNEFAGSVLGQTTRAQSGNSYALVTHLGGPIKEHKAWFFVGASAGLTGQQNTVSDALSHQALARFDYAVSPEGSGKLSYLTTVHNKAHTDNIGVEWTELLSEARDRLTVGAALQQGVKLNRQDRRLSARLRWSQRIAALGGHELTTGARVEVDRLKFSDHALGTDVEGRNVAVFMQERWIVGRNLTLTTGLHYEHSSVERAMRPSSSSRWEPRLGVAYDVTEEGRSKLFGTVSRLHTRNRLTTSDKSQGFADEAVVGAEYEFSNGFIVGADYQGRRSLVPQYHLDSVTIHLFSEAPFWLPNFQFRASYSYAKTKAIAGTSSQIGSHRFRLDGYRQWKIEYASDLYLGWSLRAANKGYRDSNLRLGGKLRLKSDRAIDVFADVASTRLPGPASLLSESSEGVRDGSKLQLSVRYSY